MRSGRTGIKAGVSAANMRLECLKSKDEGPGSVMKAYLQNQRLGVGSGGGLKIEDQRDVLLILDDGIIPVHAAILSGSSPFFGSIFETQGFILNPVREVLMPEFPVRVMQKVVDLMYNHQVYLKSEKEAEEVKKTLKYLSVNVDSKLTSAKLSKSAAREALEEVKVVPKTARSQLLQQSVVGSGVGVEGGTGKEAATEKSPLKSAPRGTIRKSQERKTSESDSDSDDSDSDFDYAETKRQTKKKPVKKVVAVKVAGGETVQVRPVTVSLEKISSNAGGSKSSETAKPSEPVVKKPIAVVRSTQQKSPDDTDTSTDYEADEGRYKNQKWFMGEAKRCQKCKTDHETAAVASQCLTGHGRLRCYFCFRVVKNTELLFNHFQRAHKKAGRENFVMCPFCDQSIPFKSVSCHVISLHLTDSNRNPKNKGTLGRPATAALVNVPLSKRPKLADATELKENDLRVGNLDCTIRHVKSNGKTWVFVCRRTRP